MSSSGDGAKSIASSHSIVRPLLASVRDFNKMVSTVLAKAIGKSADFIFMCSVR